MNQPRGFSPSTVGNPSASRRQRPRKLEVALIDPCSSDHAHQIALTD
jgi:hypothetical protein